MVLQLAAALKQPGEVFTGVIEKEIEKQSFSGRVLSFVKPVLVEFTYFYDGEAVVLEGSIGCSINSFCARCNEAITENMTIAFNERFVKSLSGNSEDCYLFDGEYLDMAKMVLDNIFLNLSMKPVCKKSCKGLCPVCGVNLNNAQCGCVLDSGAKSPLMELQSLFNDGKEV